MKFIFQISLLALLVLSACKSNQNNVIVPKSETPEAQISKYELGEIDLPIIKREVNDYEQIFTTEQVENLTILIREFEKETTNQIAIVTIDSIGEYTDFDQFAIDLSNYNGVGLSEKNNGLTFVFSKNLRRIRISTGIGTEKILTDEICQKIIDQIIIPEFKNGAYYIGTENGLKELMSKWK
ncbi:TPM domain-containing protein [Flavobacteriaceae bacterium M23B6Z8]